MSNSITSNEISTFFPCSPSEEGCSPERAALQLNHPSLFSIRTKPERTLVKVGSIVIGGPEAIVIAGPCAVESREQILHTARAVKDAGASLLRGGAFKPRTSPYSFQGLGMQALEMLCEARSETGLPVVTEIMDTVEVERVAKFADMLQVGARNMQNFALLRRVAQTQMPILLKRGPSASIKEWLLAAEYILAEGNPHVVLCERGIKTFETELRNTLDLVAVARVKELSHLPVIVDPSHATGRKSLVAPAARAALAIGAHGIMVEVHPFPENAFSDGHQSLTPQEFKLLMHSLSGRLSENRRAEAQ